MFDKGFPTGSFVSEGEILKELQIFFLNFYTSSLHNIVALVEGACDPSVHDDIVSFSYYFNLFLFCCI